MSKKSFLGKVIAITTTIVIIGGACYIFRDKIKASKIYTKLDIPTKFNKAKSFVEDKFASCCKDDADEDDFFFDDDEDDTVTFSTTSDSKSREYISLSPEGTSKITTVEEESYFEEEIFTNSPITEEAPVTEEVEVEEVPIIPTISFEEMTELKTDSPEGYENEGLSDVSEDPDVLADEDALDF